MEKLLDSEFCRNIKIFRDKKSMTLEEFGEKFGATRQQVFDWESGRYEPRRTTKDKIYRAFPDFEEIVSNATSTVRPATGLRTIKILGYIPAGFPGDPLDDAVIGLTVNNSVPDGSFALIADGDCMEPTVHSGDLVFFRPGNGARPGDMVITLDENGRAMLKRYGEKAGHPILTCDNRSYKNIEDGPETRIVGIVVKVLHESYTRPGMA